LLKQVQAQLNLAIISQREYAFRQWSGCSQACGRGRGVMEIKKTLLTKFVIGFLLVIAPLVGALFYITYYSIDVVRNQVAISNHNLLSSYLDQVDEIMGKTSNYLYNLRTVNVDAGSGETMEFGSLEYILFKLQIVKVFQADLGLYSPVDSFFMYNYKNDDIVITGGLDPKESIEIRKQLRSMIEAEADNKWKVIRKGGDDSLVKLNLLTTGFYVGAIMKADSLILPFKYIHLGDKGFIMFMTEQGVPLNGRNLDNQLEIITEDLVYKNLPYSIVGNGNDTNYLMVSQKSRWADLYLVIGVPEENLLQSLSLLKQAIYLIPLGMVAIFIAYLVLLRSVLIKPINSLVRGIRLVSKGEWNVRVPEKSSGEFLYLINSFNSMVSQINHLKINVYEERLQAEQARYNHLQSQIKPHFYMNTLNIIYNLAAVQEHKTVQKLSLYLADYFRFITRIDRESIPLSEEIKHIQNYLDIQQFRFPDAIVYQIQIPETVMDCLIPPLTLQTFVENSIIHGFQNRKVVFHILIRAQILIINSAAYVELVIEDNGSGFTPERLAELEELATIRNNRQHLGIGNVFERLQMKYAGQAVLAFSNREAGGAAVTVLIPCQRTAEGGSLDVQSVNRG
jgi:two-component system sensor histidine kinase YesM